MVTVDEELCVGCGLCETVCPTGALKAWGNLEVEERKCNDCLECTEICPVGALSVKQGIASR